MSLVLDRPYQFVPPHRGNGWPSFIQTFRIVDFFLKRDEGVVEYECRGLEHLRASLDRDDAVLLTPNHCRYADPLVLGWPARELGTHVYAMASWHLFNKGRFDSFAIRKMGGFSINREGSDRQSLETAIEILTTAERPLILFPEGTTNRTNDVLKPLLDGVAFIARTAARRRAKACDGKLVMQPVALKYLCVGDARDWADRQLTLLESRLGWSRPGDQSVLARTIRLAEALLSLKEIEYFGCSQSGDLPQRRDCLIEHLLNQSERRLGLPESDDGVRDRVRAIRSDVVAKHFSTDGGTESQHSLRDAAVAADLAQDLMSYVDCYLQPDEVTDTRIVETIQRIQETFLGKADVSVPLKVVIEFAAPIPVPIEKAPRGEPDPLMIQLHAQLASMLDQLSGEARSAGDAGLR